jgi:hypothetical protein
MTFLNDKDRLTNVEWWKSLCSVVLKIIFSLIRHSKFNIRHSLISHRLPVFSGVRCRTVSIRQAVDYLGTAKWKDIRLLAQCVTAAF